MNITVISRTDKFPSGRRFAIFIRLSSTCTLLTGACLKVVSSLQARQTRPNSGGVTEGHPRFDKGEVAIIFYFLRVKNITF